MSETTETSTRTEAEILAELERTRTEMTATVDELFARVQPERLFEEAKTFVQTKSEEVKKRVATTVQDAREGDPEALKKVGYVIVGTAGLSALILCRFLRKKR